MGAAPRVDLGLHAADFGGCYSNCCVLAKIRVGCSLLQPFLLSPKEMKLVKICP